MSEKTWVGACDEDNKVIYIEKNLEDPVFKKVLIHEVTHAFIQEFLMFKYNKTMRWSEEDLCVFMENYAEDILCEVEKYMKGRQNGKYED